MEKTTDTDDNKEKKGEPKGLLVRTWRKCLSMRNSSRSMKLDGGLSRYPKAKSWPRREVTPEGFFSVCVGPGKEKYVIRTQCLNHPLFRSLLDEAEMEYGYDVEGPLKFPCDVGHFEEVLSEIENDESYHDLLVARRPLCNFAHNSYRMLSPVRPSMIYRSRW